jgi:hypothetical protein
MGVEEAPSAGPTVSFVLGGASGLAEASVLGSVPVGLVPAANPEPIAATPLGESDPAVSWTPAFELVRSVVSAGPPARPMMIVGTGPGSETGAAAGADVVVVSCSVTAGADTVTTVSVEETTVCCAVALTVCSGAAVTGVV